MAPEWTTNEELILVASIASTEGDWLTANFSNFQQWEILVGKCTAMGVGRNLYQFRAKWTSLLSDYNLIREWNSMAAGDQGALFDSYWYLESENRERFGLPERFDDRVFRAIDDYVGLLQSGGSGRFADPKVETGADVAADFFVEIPGPVGDPLLQDLEAELYHQEAALEEITYQPEPEFMEEINQHQPCHGQPLFFSEEQEEQELEGRHCWEKMETAERAEEEKEEEEEEERALQQNRGAMMMLGEQRRYNRGRKPKALVEEEKMAERVYETAQLMLAVAKGNDDDDDDKPLEEDGEGRVGIKAEIVDILDRYPYLVRKYS
ncbi:Trihelix transcription factor ASR3 [Linum grandiflorum]